MYQHILGNLLLLALLTLGTGKLNLPFQVNPHRDKGSPPVEIAPYANPKFKPIALDLLDYITQIYPEEELTEKLVNGKESLYASGVLCDLPGSEDMWGKYGTCGAIAKVYFEPKKIDDLPKPGKNSSYGYENVDMEANQLIEDILNCTDDESKNVNRIVPEFTFIDSGLILLNVDYSVSSIHRKMVTDKETVMVEFGGYFREFKSRGTTIGQLVALFYAYPINETKEDVPSTMVSNIKESISDWRMERLYPPIKPIPAIPIETKTPADIVAEVMAILTRYGRTTDSTNNKFGNPKGESSSEHFSANDIKLAVSASSNQSIQTDVYQPPQPPKLTTIKGQNQSCFICVEFTDNENPDRAFLDHLTKYHFRTRLPPTPQALNALAKNTRLNPELNQILALTTMTLEVAIVRQGNRFIFVLHTMLNPFLTKDWKLPDEFKNWKYDLGACYKMINYARKCVDVKPFLKIPSRMDVVDFFAKILYTHLNTPESNSNSLQCGCGMFIPTVLGLDFGIGAFSFMLDPNTALNHRSTVQEQRDQGELQTTVQIQNILLKTASEGFDDLRLQRINPEIVIFRKGVEPSNRDFAEMTSDHWKVVNYGAYIPLGENRSPILTVLFYQKGNSILEFLTEDKSVEDFINGFKSSHVYRPIQLSPQTVQALQFIQAIEHLTRIPAATGKGTVGSSGFLRYIDSWFIFIEILGEDIPFEKVLEIITGFWNGNKTDHQLSPAQLLDLEFIHRNVPSSQLLSLILLTDKISYIFARTGTSYILLLQVTLPQILPPDWSTPRDSIKKTVDDLRKRLNVSPGQLLTTPPKKPEEGCNKAIKHIEEKRGESSGLVISGFVAITHMTIKRDDTKPQHMSSPVLRLLIELTLIADGCIMSNNITIPPCPPFPDGTRTEGFISISDRISLLNFALVAIYGSLTVQISSKYDLKENCWWDTVLVISEISGGLYGIPRYNWLAYDMINMYLTINGFPSYNKVPNLVWKIPPEVPPCNKVVHYNLSDYNCFDGFVLKWLSDLEFSANLDPDLVHLGLFLPVFHEAINRKLPLHETFTGLKMDKNNQYTCYLIDAGKEGSDKWSQKLKPTVTGQVIPRDWAEKAQKLKTYLLHHDKAIKIRPSFGLFGGDAASIIDLGAVAETVSSTEFVSEQVSRLICKKVPSPTCIAQGNIQLTEDYAPLFGSVSTMDLNHLTDSEIIAVEMLILKREGTTVSFLIIVYSNTQLDKIGNTMLESITKQPPERVGKLGQSRIRWNVLEESTFGSAIISGLVPTLGLVVTAGIIASFFNVKSTTALDKSIGLLTLLVAIETPPPPLAVGGVANFPVIVTRENNPEGISLLCTDGDVGLHNMMAMTYPVNGVYYTVIKAQPVFVVIYGLLPSNTSQSFVSEFLSTLLPSHVPQMKFSTELSHLAGALGVAMTLKPEPNSAKFVSLAGAFGFVIPFDGEAPFVAKEMAARLLSADNSLTSLKSYFASLFQADVKSALVNTEMVSTMLVSSTMAGAQIVEVGGYQVAIILFDQPASSLRIDMLLGEIKSN